MLKENLHEASKQKRGLILLGCRVLQKMQNAKNAFENIPKKNTSKKIFYLYVLPSKYNAFRASYPFFENTTF